MKKFLVILVALVGLTVFLMSCEKDDDDKMCCCDGDCVSMKTIKVEGYSSCAEAKRDWECD